MQVSIDCFSALLHMNLGSVGLVSLSSSETLNSTLASKSVCGGLI